MFDIDNFKTGELAIFAGAGISSNSGLPLANELKKSILTLLTKNQDDIDIIMDSKMPFELFIQNLTNDASDQIFKIFKYGEPNGNHILIAKLAKLGIVKTIITTNFDMLLEKAMLGEKVNCNIHYSDDDFSNLIFKKIDDTPRIFKIHGSVDDYNSLFNTINKVGRPLTVEKEALLDYFFLNGTHDKILILGYSCSDIFDINLYLAHLKGSCKNVTLLNHTINDSFDIKHLNSLDDQHPFSKLNGFQIKCNTNVLIQDLWQIFEGDIGEYYNPTNRIKWNTHVNKWGKSLKYGLKESILGNMFTSIGNYSNAEKYFNLSLKIAKRHKKVYPQYYCNLCLCNISLKHGYLDEAFSYCKNALKATDLFSSELEKVHCISTLGRIYAGMKEYDKAIDHLMSSLKYYESHEDEHSISKIYMELGSCYFGMDDQQKAIEYYNGSLGLKIKLGDILGTANCDSNLGGCYSLKRNYMVAIDYYKMAVDIFAKLGMEDMIAKVYWSISKQYGYLNDYENEGRYKEKAKSMASNVNYLSSETKQSEVHRNYTQFIKFD